MNKFDQWWNEQHPRCPENEPSREIARQAWNAALEATAESLTKTHVITRRVERRIEQLRAECYDCKKYLNNTLETHKRQADEIERLRERLASYDSQWSQIAAFAGGDARHCKGHQKTIAGFVCQEIEKLRSLVESEEDSVRQVQIHLRGAMGDVALARGIARTLWQVWLDDNDRERYSHMNEVPAWLHKVD